MEYRSAQHHLENIVHRCAGRVSVDDRVPACNSRASRATVSSLIGGADCACCSAQTRSQSCPADSGVAGSRVANSGVAGAGSDSVVSAY